MPTGYTAAVADGTVTDFATFALQCARAFGATILQRDDPAKDPPRLIPVSDYHAKRIVEAEARLAELQAMTVEEAGRRADADHAKAVEERWRYRRERRATESRYEAMRADVEKWTPPTPDHAGLRKFMLDQIADSVKFDCVEYGEDPVAKTGAEWLAAERAKAAHDIGYHRNGDAEEQERTRTRHEWIRALYLSLNLAAPSVPRDAE